MHSLAAKRKKQQYKGNKMRLDEITVDGAPSKAHGIIKDAFLQVKRDGVGIIREFEPFHKHVKIRESDGQPNLVEVVFKTPRPRGGLKFQNIPGKTEDELDWEQKQKAARQIAMEMLQALHNRINVEEANIDAGNDSVVLFIVSDDFIGEDN